MNRVEPAVILAVLADIEVNLDTHPPENWPLAKVRGLLDMIREVKAGIRADMEEEFAKK